MTLSEVVREAMRLQIRQNPDEYTAEDILRAFQQEATLMFETDRLQQTLRSDPFECGADTKRLEKLAEVVDCQRLSSHLGIMENQATVRIRADKLMQQHGVKSHVQLDCFFSRERLPEGGTRVWYSMDVSRDHGPLEKVLWCQVLAAGDAPSALPAVDMDADDEDGWEDIEDDDDEASSPALKKQKSDSSSESKEEPDAAVLGGEADRYTAGMDPDALQQFLQWTQVDVPDEASAFFLLMTFPYHDAEWDLVGYILDAVFGNEDDGE